MADFRMKLFVLAGMATVFAGMASAQVVCSANSATVNAVFVRSESNDDQVADTTMACTSAGGTAAASVGLTVYLSPSVNITSFNVGTGGTPHSEAIAGVTGNFAVGGGVPWVSGSVSGNSVTFSGIAVPACAAGPACAVSLTITNIKIAASTVATGSGVPTGVSETIFVSGTNTTPSAVTTGSAVAYVTSGLNGIKSSGTSSNPLCNPVNTWNTVANVLTASVPNFTVTFAEAFPNSFKIQGNAAANNALGLWYTNHTETGTGVTAYTTPNTATSGTRIKLIFNNIPANVTLYVPITFGGAAALPNTASAATNGAVLTLTASETGALSPVAGSAATGAPGSTSTSTNNGGITTGNSSAAPLTVASGSTTAIYEVTTVSTAPGTFAIPVYMQAAAGAVPAPTSAITATVSFAPIGAASNVPNFINAASTTTVNGSTFAACSTTLMFPFVTNTAGFETGLAIANTGTDLLGTKNGAPVSSVTGQSGTCILTFFTSATNPAAYTTPSVAPGTTWASTLTSVTGGTAGNVVGGYTIAQCNFLFAHGYAFIVYNVGQSSAMAEGYLALEVTTGRAATSGAPESLNN